MERAKFLVLLPKTKVDERKEEKDKIDRELLSSRRFPHANLRSALIK